VNRGEPNVTSSAAANLRTPGQRGDHIMEQARNALLMQTADTPLLGGENEQLDQMDWSGITPKPSTLRTPNPLATPLTDGNQANNHIKTPLRDTLGLNTPQALQNEQGQEEQIEVDHERTNNNDLANTPGAKSMVSIATATTAMSEREKQKRRKIIKQRLREELSSLPSPTNDCAIALPDTPPLTTIAFATNERSSNEWDVRRC